MPISAAVDQSPDLRVPHLAKLLQWRAEQYPNQLAYIFLESDGTEQRLTYGELDRRARVIAAAVYASGGAGQRVLIVCPPGLDYLAAFFGCLYADAIAVPAYSPTTSRASRTLPRLQAIVADAQAALALTTSAAREVVTGIYGQAPELARLSWIIVDELNADGDVAPLPAPSQSLAFLMYTSGSTSTPKGVMVSHANALHNAAAFPGFRSRPCQSIVSWLPLFHDLGLFLGVIHPLYQGVPAVLMSPADFVRQPLRWLEAMSRFRGTTTGGPNFAYELCVRKTTEEQRARLDLSSWNLALNGAEPIRPETLQRFAETFAAAGFRPEAFYPSYGLADATATVTGTSDFSAPYVLSLKRQELAQRRVSLAEPNDPLALTLVGCGGGLDGQVIRIVDPNSGHPCAADAVGEIWVSSPSIGQGYWNRPAETERVFGARLAADGDRTFLRTGDLGFLHGGELFIAGRLRDLIIIRGQNYYPEDIELTVERSHPLLRAGCGAAFALDVDGEERLALVHEIEDPSADPAPIIAAIRRVVIEHYDVLAHRLVLIAPGTIPKTSSGKIQRSACRTQLLDGTLKPIADWQHQRGEPAARSAHQPTTIERWIADWLARQIGIAADRIDRRAPLSSYDLDSMSAMTLVGELEQWLGRQLSPTLVWSYPSIEALAAYLAGEIRPADSTVAHTQPSEHDPIAIVGMDCRFPGAPDVEAFWRLLMDQGDAITEIPASRWDAAALYSADSSAPGKLTTRWGGFLADADAFDAQLFGISPREAAHIDPQQRLLLEVAWAALEHAGERPDALAGSATGVFMGICNSDHARLELEEREAITQYGGTGTSYSLVANRLSYTFDLRGPSIAIDTACSSSLVALHLACQSLRSGECDRALAGGVNLILSPEISIAFSKARMMAADGHCKTFDAGADGYVRSEGVGVLVLKRLSQALADGDRVLALVRGTAINQDGRSNGITAPNGLAQQAVIAQAFRQSGISPAQVGYIEAHGTGTPLGDAIEIAAWDAVLGNQTERIPIGSVKTNIGHTEAAAGVAGVIKTVLAMQHGCIPPQLYGHDPNLQLNPQNSALEVVLTARSWDTSGDRRFASVSSFGFGGTNAHAVLEAPSKPADREPMQDRTHHMLMLSGRDERALIEQAQRFSQILASGEPSAFADVCYTANRGRAHLSQRLALVADTSETAASLLSQVISGQETSLLWRGEVTGRAEPVAFVFTGQGPQYVQMARELYESHPVFRATLDECQRLLASHVDVPLLSYLYPAPGDPVLPEDDWRLQPALFAIEYALAQLWISWGVKPDVVLGHSMGEYCAACVAGVFSLADALKLVTYRAKLVERLPKDGAMAAVLAPAAVVHEHLARFNGAISVASYNSASLVIVSGAKTALQALGEELQRAEISFRPLPISNAFHSPAMRPIVDDFAAIAASVSYSPPRFALVANLTGTLAEPDQLGADYWVRHLLEPVQFQQSIECLVAQQYRIFVEMGPRPTLTNTIKRIVPNDSSYLILASLSGHAEQPDWLMLMSALGQLAVRGIDIDWRAVD
ncbi:MAG: AMP-binding protein, partial [Chloroflexi bacterium]|nr:AMP-binding protein [Chloroflexota bacterium]